MFTREVNVYKRRKCLQENVNTLKIKKIEDKLYRYEKTLLETVYGISKKIW